MNGHSNLVPYLVKNIFRYQC